MPSAKMTEMHFKCVICLLMGSGIDCIVHFYCNCPTVCEDAMKRFWKLFRIDQSINSHHYSVCNLFWSSVVLYIYSFSLKQLNK